MANHNASDIRQILNLIESVASPTVLQEWGSMQDREKAAIDRVKAATDPATKGKLEHKALKDRLKDGWVEWKAKTGHQGNMDDLVQYLNVRVGLEPNDIRIIMGHEQTPKAEPENNEYRPGAEEPEEEDPETEFGRQAEEEPTAEEEPNSYNNLTPAQKQELERNGKITLPGGKTMWVGKPGEETPDTIRTVKDQDIKSAADDIMNMSDEEFEEFSKRAEPKAASDEETFERLRDELRSRQKKLEDKGRTAEASDLEDIVSRLEKEVGVNTNESILVENKLSSQQTDMVFDEVTKYVFANGVLARTDKDKDGRRRSRGAYGDEGEDDDVPQGMSNKVRAFLRQNDVTDEMVHSLRETSRRARGLGSFKGAQDHKVLAMIGLAYLKYRD